MADVAKTAQKNGVVDTRTAMYAMQNTGLVAGEDLQAGQAVRIGVGFKVYRASNTAGSRFDGIAPKDAKAGQPVTIFGVGTRFHATEGDLDPTKHYYTSVTPGLFADTGTGEPVARSVSKHDLEVIRVGKV